MSFNPAARAFHEPVDLASPDVLSFLRSIGSLTLIVIPAVYYLSFLRPIRNFANNLLPDIASLESLIPPRPASRDELRKARRYKSKVWLQTVLVVLGLAEVAVWTGITGSKIMTTRGREAVRDILLSVGMVFVWAVLALRPLLRAPNSPPWSALSIYLLLWIISLASLSLAWFEYASTGHLPSWADKQHLIMEGLNLSATTILVGSIGTLRLASPEALTQVPYVSPDDEVRLFSWLTFIWLNPFIAFGSRKEMDENDLPVISMTMQSAVIFDRFKQTQARSLLFQLLKAHRLDLFFDAFFTLTGVVFNYAGPFFLKRILEGLTIATPEALSAAYVFAALALVASCAKGVTDLLHLYYSRRASVRIKAGLTTTIYDKALRRKDASGVVAPKPGDEKKDGGGQNNSNADAGKVVNLMAADTNRIANIIAGMYFLYGSPFEIIVAATFLYQILGWSAFAGIVVLCIVAPLNSLISKQSVQITQDLLKKRDKRVGIVTELINAIQFIKFFAWVENWKARVAEARRQEMKTYIRSMINNLWFALLWNLAPMLVTLLSFFCFIVIEKKELTVSVAFTSISLFTMLRLPLNVIPTYIVFMLQAHVSVKRIQEFLEEDEVPEWVSSLKRSPYARSTDATKIGFVNATLKWNSGTQKQEAASKDKSKKKGQSPLPSQEESTANGDNEVFHLSNLNVNFPIGKLTCITGPTGSGKTAILVALLGEMELIEGSSSLPKDTMRVDPKTGLRNSVSYAAQTPWLQQQSIKDNILFGEKFDEDRYEATVEACALNPDFDMLEDGDMTEIGAKGVSLSGGQKARVALARAIYSYTQHVLLDDPLAAVDSHTAKHLTDKCLNGPLLKGRTVIIVSHHVELLLPCAGYLVRILDGRIDAQGTPDEIRAAGNLDGLIKIEEAEIVKKEGIVVNEEVADEVQVVDGEKSVQEVKKKRKEGPGKKLIKDEERAVGNVKWETYKLYIISATYITWVVSFVVLIMGQFTSVGERFWLKLWGEAYNTQLQSMMAFVRPGFFGIHDQSHQHVMSDHSHHILHHSPMSNGTMGVLDVKPSGSWRSRLPSATAHPEFYLAGYTIIILSDALLGVVQNAVSSWGQYRAAVRLHDRLLDSVVRGTIRFFNVTPVGRIINRFSRDIESVDSSVNWILKAIINYIVNLIAAIIIVAIIVPWFLVPAVIISYIYWRYSVIYLRVGRSLRRLESTLRSPIFSGFAELLDGVVSVRAFSVEPRFMKQLCERVDMTSAAHYQVWMMNRWLLLRFDILGAFSVFLTTILTLSGTVAAGSAGMAILSAQGFVSACYWTSRFWGQLEMDFNSVERVQEYLEIPKEPPATIANRKPPAYWPSTESGDHFLEVEDLEIKYDPELPTVFKGSFSIKAGEKIGLIGRTGSGKSTLAMSLLRFSEPYSGKIVLDGIDITSIGVDDLRSRITYIPQDAVLFSGTVKENLDPFNEHSEDELMETLARVGLGQNASPPTSRIPSRVPSSNRLAAIAAEHAQEMEGSGTLTPSSAAGKHIITLSSEVSSGGTNFSQGQRQLVAMARALLRRSNLIIMDEATASVDFATDESLQRTIRTEFKNSTLLTIAHRLSSVIDYDRLLVLSDGKVAEFDTPINLLRKEESLFKSLCENSGKYKELFKAAEKKEAEGRGSTLAA
ncbi:hypothetical protein BD324DRAFT_613230 [Kockovaella imperatae]|uniref:ATP-binding cassette transporter n=1 Tax=Kockovaella imperatae TaxID=4999 RepID=A0A1Y1USX5_9TREE|nr:hypothetical protein BD324DRAFT_613230 [Kockovaella imperatae]ORX41111.1 hypothetical protein BD324DRAFT_613230 [Kockovaella imperatae]